MAALYAIASGCGKQSAPPSGGAPAGPMGPPAEQTLFQVHCVTEAVPTPEPGMPLPSVPPEPQLPQDMAQVRAPIEIESCPGLESIGPHFVGGEMPGFITVLDCNNQLVRLRTRDWRIATDAPIGPTGDFSARLLYISRLAVDVQGAPYCWTRFIGDVSGHANCPAANPNNSHVEFKVRWSIDSTPAEAMEAPSPGQADFRNGPHCTLSEGKSCSFVNHASMGCGG